MGNCVSAKVQDQNVRPISMIRVLQAAEGRVVEVEVPDLQMSMKVGELMLEFPPGNFVAQFDQADLDSGNINGKRASPLGADADATSGLVYVLFPMPRLHTRVTTHELSAFAKLLHLHHDQQLAKRSSPSKGAGAPRAKQQHGLFASGGGRVAPLPELEEEADSGDANIYITTTEHANNAMALDGDRMFQQQQQNGKESIISFCPNSSPVLTRSCHSQMQVIKSKPWAPKLETIKESS